MARHVAPAWFSGHDRITLALLMGSSGNSLQERRRGGRPGLHGKGGAAHCRVPCQDHAIAEATEFPALAFMLFTAARRKSDTKETKLREAARKIRRKMSSGDNGRVSVVGGNAGCPKPNDLSHHFQLVNFWEISKFLRVAVNCTVQMSEGAVRKKILICIIFIECPVFLYCSIALKTLYLKSFDLNFM